MHSGITARTCVFVISHPRSGTHLLIDFIRKNFQEFNRKLKPWESASLIYVGLDRANWREEIATQLRDRKETHFLLHSHYSGIVSATHLEAAEKLKPARAIVLYPFRRFSTTIKSYAEFRQFRGSIGSFLPTVDDFFGLDATVKKCVELHAEKWLQPDVHFVDTDRLALQPDIACSRLAELFNEKPVETPQRLPRRKWFGGRLGEFAERLTGRESSEFRVDYDIPWQSAEEKAAVDEQFAGLYSELSGRRIN
jgi:hypothetical protein